MASLLTPLILLLIIYLLAKSKPDIKKLERLLEAGVIARWFQGHTNKIKAEDFVIGVLAQVKKKKGIQLYLGMMGSWMLVGIWDDQQNFHWFVEELATDTILARSETEDFAESQSAIAQKHESKANQYKASQKFREAGEELELAARAEAMKVKKSDYWEKASHSYLTAHLRDDAARTLKVAIDTLGSADATRSGKMYEQMSRLSKEEADQLMYLEEAMAIFQSSQNVRWKSLCREIAENYADKRNWSQSLKFWRMLDGYEEECNLCDYAMGVLNVQLGTSRRRTGWRRVAFDEGSILAGSDLR